MDVNCNYKAILLDIEGTTTPISFVHDILFPYAKSKLKDYINVHWNSQELQNIITALREESEDHYNTGKYPEVVKSSNSTDKEDIFVKISVLNYLQWQMENDLKTKPLKELQSKIFKEAFENGTIKGDVYDDVPVSMKRWKEAEGKNIYIYSSGAIAAQKLLFGYSTFGNLCNYITDYFDLTTSGSKIEASSYIKIAQSIGIEPENILFLTDIPKEGYAAKIAKMNVFIMIRPGNKPLTENEMKDFQTQNSFELI